MSSSKLNEVYKLYTSWKYLEADKLNKEILSTDPDNMYAKKYTSLLSSKITWTTNWAIPKVKWKQLKCPHCLSRITFSWLNESQQKAIKSKEYSNLEIKCPYCHTEFVLQEKNEKSIIGIKIWETLDYNSKKYRVTWYVKYKWKWIEWSYSWKLEYLEWLLLWEDNSYMYFSEGYFYDDGIKKQEFEFSQKFVPEFIPDKTSAKERNDLKVVSVNWENSKSYKIWERVEILDFWKFVMEKEWSWSQTEAWFYRSNSVSRHEASKIFWKEIIWRSYNSSTSYGWDNSNSIINLAIYWIVFLFIASSFAPAKYLVWAVVVSVIIWSLVFFGAKMSEKIKILLYGLVIIPLSWLLIFQPIFGAIMDDKKSVNLSDIDNNKKYEATFKYNSLKKQETTSSTRYDYGGTRTYYKENTWLKFSVKDDKDMEVIEKIKSLEDWELKRIFEWQIYKLR